ncbi:MAG: phosphoribulokinase [Alcanivoracaceae bacterium]|nr:phosphoribulokinase [Alcanivoracaceae bacterium]
MSKKHPVIAVTGSSGAGTTTVKKAFEEIFHRQNIKPVIIEGDSFHRYSRKEMKKKVQQAQKNRRNFSHFGFEANILKELENTFKTYGETGQCKRRYYVHTKEKATSYGLNPGEFTTWENVGENSDLLLYEGLHGAIANEQHDINIAQYADLKIGVVPIVNLEWIQKIHRDTAKRGYKPEDVTNTILRRMRDYVNVITPQFSQTDINFQRVPLVDTSNPFDSRVIPTSDESMVVIRFKDYRALNIDFSYLQSMLHRSWMSRRNTIVVPGGKMVLAMEVILHPIIKQMLNEKNR